MSWSTLLPLVTGILLGGCSAPAPPDTSTPWYLRTRTLDLTADGRPDSVRLTAAGSRADSVRVTLSIIVASEEKHHESWGSSYELALADSSVRSGRNADAFLRARLDSALASVVVEPMDAPTVRLMAEDSAMVARIDPRPTHRISYSYGYETTVRLVWDAPRARFVRLWSCC